ncbi:type II secretion system major pseudopilin GspG [Pseudidiomarina insulisalsae]|uniref:Type II secretion system core protein G n=1 Tax=Pseudidiomarina insulisalsae TaxID=575789 RepID=A0A432YNR0_9GAMM|nr:type II secretion system major pseudopilin GspG [Pseudidiomarina insulisalsae]RUO62584.1 type II secretion system protein GspG [Pseudidiomarina insulisalsae]
MKTTKGFSLIEIMVVIVILGLLATLILPNVLGSAEQANVQKAKSDIIALENALVQYKLDNNSYPTTEQGLEALLNEPTMDPLPRNYRRGGYIRRLPTDPYGADYLMLSPGEYGEIDVFSAGEDRQPGTDDDIGNWNLDQN